MTPCPVCAGETTRVFAKDGFWIRACAACRHRFAEAHDLAGHVERVYDDAYFCGEGAGYPDYLAEAGLREAQGRRYARLLRRYTRPGTLLDVGAAAGFLLRGFLRQGWRGQGIEPNARMAQHGTQLGLHIVKDTLEDFKADQQFDLLCLVQVVAHFVDVRRAFAAAARLTKPGGLWLIETWDVTSWTASLFGRHWHEYSPPSVLHWFSRRSLRTLARQFGMREVGRGRPSKWISGQHAKALLRHKTRGPWPELLRIVPGNWAIPYPAEDLFWALFLKAT